MSASRGEPPTKRIKLEEEEEETDVVTSEIEYAATSSLCSLPNEILIKILLYLDTRDKIRTKLVNRRMYGVVDDPILWQHVEIKDAYYKNIKSLLRICQPHARSLCICEGITIPFSRQYQSLVIGFKNVEELVLNGFDVTGRALQTLATELPHLSSLTLSCTSTTSFNSTIEQIPSLRYLNKLSLYIDKTLSTIKYFPTLVDTWYNADCYPNLLYLFCRYFSRLPQCRSPPSIPHNASLFFYFSYRRPLNLQFNLVPKFHLQLGPHKDQELVCTVNKSLNIKVMHCDNPEINTKLRTTYKVGVLSRNYPAAPALGNAAIPFCLSIGCELTFLNFTCISARDELSVDQLIDVLRFTPNLVEFTLTGKSCTGDIIELIHTLVQYCKSLKGLNISMCLVNVDKLHLWRALSSISRLQYLTISMCSFSPPLTEVSSVSQIVWGLDNSVKNQMCSIFKQMIMLKALHVNNMCIKVLPNGDDHWITLQLLQQHLLEMISNMTNLHYLKLNIEFQCDQELSGLADVLQNCTQLRVLYVHTRVLRLPSNSNLYANLTHLYISCTSLLSEKFIDFNGKFSLKHFVLIATNYKIAFPDLIKFLDFCDLYTCQIFLSALKKTQQTIIKDILSDNCVSTVGWRHYTFDVDNTDFDDLFCYDKYR
jgi:hypothetical protein